MPRARAAEGPGPHWLARHREAEPTPAVAGRRPKLESSGWFSAVGLSEAALKTALELHPRKLKSSTRRIKLFPGIFIASQQKAEKQLREKPKQSNVQ